jgi:hypothetical protein
MDRLLFCLLCLTVHLSAVQAVLVVEAWFCRLVGLAKVLGDCADIFHVDFAIVIQVSVWVP